MWRWKPPSHQQCCLEEVAAQVGQESLASGGAGGRGISSRLDSCAGGRSTGSEAAGRSRSAGDGNAGGCSVSAGGGNRGGLGGSSGLSRGALCALTVAIAGGLGLDGALE